MRNLHNLIVNFQGSAKFEYSFNGYSKPGYFSGPECLDLNSGYAQGSSLIILSDFILLYFFISTRRYGPNTAEVFLR